MSFIFLKTIFFVICEILDNSGNHLTEFLRELKNIMIIKYLMYHLYEEIIEYTVNAQLILEIILLKARLLMY